MSSQSFALGRMVPPSILDHSRVQTALNIARRTPTIHVQHSLTPTPQFSHETGLQITWNRPISVAAARTELLCFPVRFSPSVLVCSMWDHYTDLTLTFQPAANPGPSALGRKVPHHRDHLNPSRYNPASSFGPHRTFPHSHPLNPARCEMSNRQKSADFHR